MKLQILPNALPERIAKAIREGESGDYEVLSYLAENDVVDDWWKLVNGEEKHFSLDTMKAAIQSGFEVREPAPRAGRRSE